MPRILSFDPGHLTGIAYLDRDGEFRWGMTVTAEEVKGRDFFRGLTMLAKPDLIVMEEPPHFARDGKTLEVYHLVRNWFQVAGLEVVTINPGQWKGMGQPLKISGLHQQDATNLARWFRRHRQLPVPDPTDNRASKFR